MQTSWIVFVSWLFDSGVETRGNVCFWVGGSLDNILTSIVSHFHSGRRLVARGMTICAYHVGLHVSEHLCVFQRFVHSWAAKPAQGLFLVFQYCLVGEKLKYLVRMHRCMSFAPKAFS